MLVFAVYGDVFGTRHNSLREYENNNKVLISCTVVKEAGVAQSV
jgi:hypothetical protein